jgi:hypothetical protein
MPAKAATAVDVLIIAALRLNSREIWGVPQGTLLNWARNAGLKISERTFRTSLRTAEQSGMVITYEVYGVAEDGEIRQAPNGYKLNGNVNLSGAIFKELASRHGYDVLTVAVGDSYPEPCWMPELPEGWEPVDLRQPASVVHSRVVAGLVGEDMPF